jgi:hypothetical protein
MSEEQTELCGKRDAARATSRAAKDHRPEPTDRPSDRNPRPAAKDRQARCQADLFLSRHESNLYKRKGHRSSMSGDLSILSPNFQPCSNRRTWKVTAGFPAANFATQARPPFQLRRPKQSSPRGDSADALPPYRSKRPAASCRIPATSWTS